MADPRFFENHGPFRLADLTDIAAVELADAIDDAAVGIPGIAQHGATSSFQIFLCLAVQMHGFLYLRGCPAALVYGDTQLQGNTVSR